jgi:hypothetical protein
MFTINAIPPERAESMRKTNVWTSECPIPIERLKLLKIEHYNFNNETQQGEIIVFDAVAHVVIEIFKRLHKIKFPIAKMCPIDDYQGNDEASMEDNNSSAFNFRKISGSDKLSLHGLGMAIDINPVQNPFLEVDKENATVKVLPKAGIKHINRSAEYIANRSKDSPKEYIGKAESAIKIFNEHGFKVWGGSWGEPIDYHHFQVEREIAEKLITLDPYEGIELFLGHCNNSHPD